MTLKDLWRQFINLIPALLLIYVPAVIFIVVLYVVYLTRGIPFSIFFQDPASSLEFVSANGLVSNMGILLLSSAAAICIFCYLVLRSQGRASGNALFLLYFGLITALLTIDDLFMVHEVVGDSIAAVASVTEDLGEAITFAVYVLIIIYFVVKYRKVIYRTEYFLFISSFVFFGLSILLDLMPVGISLENEGFWRKFFGIGEDIIKFFAIINWFAYAGKTALKMLKNQDLEI